MFDRFAKAARHVVVQAEHEARALGSPSVEAEHVLLALTGDPSTGPALAEGGLDRDALLAALEVELATALEAVGVSVEAFGPPPPVAVAGRLRFGTSAKSALERALKLAVARGDRRLGSGHLALALLQAERGTLPRALAAAGIDAQALRDHVAATLQPPPR